MFSLMISIRLRNLIPLDFSPKARPLGQLAPADGVPAEGS